MSLWNKNYKGYYDPETSLCSQIHSLFLKLNFNHTVTHIVSKWKKKDRPNKEFLPGRDLGGIHCGKLENTKFHMVIITMQ